MSERDNLACEMFPTEWSIATSGTGKKFSRMRNQLRNAAEVEFKLRPLRASGATCATCKNFEKYPYRQDTYYCHMKSDFEGYEIVKADNLCQWWSKKPPPRPDRAGGGVGARE